MIVMLQYSRDLLRRMPTGELPCLTSVSAVGGPAVADLGDEVGGAVVADVATGRSDVQRAHNLRPVGPVVAGPSAGAHLGLGVAHADKAERRACAGLLRLPEPHVRVGAPGLVV